MLEYFFGKNKIEEFENILIQNEYSGSFSDFVKASVFLGAILFVIAVVLQAFFIAADYFFIIIIAFVFFAIGFCANFFVQFYLFDFRRKTIERFVPDLLLSAAVFPAGSSLNKIISEFSKTNYRFLSKEFEKCNEEILKGCPAVQALIHLKKRNCSVVLDRCVDLIVSGINSGCDVSLVFKETALDLLETASIIRERVAALTIEKYTLLGAGAIIVPAILGVLVGIVSGLNFDGIEGLGIGLSAVQRKELVSAALFSAPVYLVEYCVIASFFVAFQENDLKKGIIYCAILSPLCIAVYYFIPSLF